MGIIDGTLFCCDNFLVGLLQGTAQLSGRLMAKQLVGNLRLLASSGDRDQLLGVNHLGGLGQQIAGVGFTVRRFETGVVGDVLNRGDQILELCVSKRRFQRLYRCRTLAANLLLWLDWI